MRKFLDLKNLARCAVFTSFFYGMLHGISKVILKDIDQIIRDNIENEFDVVLFLNEMA